MSCIFLSMVFINIPLTHISPIFICYKLYRFAVQNFYPGWCCSSSRVPLQLVECSPTLEEHCHMLYGRIALSILHQPLVLLRIAVTLVNSVSYMCAVQWGSLTAGGLLMSLGKVQPYEPYSSSLPTGLDDSITGVHSAGCQQLGEVKSV